jgi:hypothetical protein
LVLRPVILTEVFFSYSTYFQIIIHTPPYHPMLHNKCSWKWVISVHSHYILLFLSCKERSVNEFSMTCNCHFLFTFWPITLTKFVIDMKVLSMIFISHHAMVVSWPVLCVLTLLFWCFSVKGEQLTELPRQYLALIYPTLSHERQMNYRWAFFTETVLLQLCMIPEHVCASLAIVQSPR